MLWDQQDFKTKPFGCTQWFYSPHLFYWRHKRDCCWEPLLYTLVISPEKRKLHKQRVSLITSLRCGNQTDLQSAAPPEIRRLHTLDERDTTATFDSAAISPKWTSASSQPLLMKRRSGLVELAAALTSGQETLLLEVHRVDLTWTQMTSSAAAVCCCVQQATGFRPIGCH